MTTIKLKFRPSSVLGAMGTLYYQVIHKRSVKWISTEHHVYAEEWNEEQSVLVIQPGSKRRADLLLMQSVLDWEMKQREEIVCSLEADKKDFTLEELCSRFAGIPMQKTVFTFLQEQILRQERMKRLGTANTYTSAYLVVP